MPAGASQALIPAAKSPEKPTPEVPPEKQIPRQASPQGTPKEAPKEAMDQTQPTERPAAEQTESAQSRPADTPRVEAKPQVPIARASGSDQQTLPAAKRSTPQTVFRLQFFLVIGLVVITIGILCLLLMMLFARHRFSKVKSKLRASDFLQEQDKKIEAIDERIKKQIERYEKA
jgi:outer membrane biosynthesis protein TonB